MAELAEHHDLGLEGRRLSSAQAAAGRGELPARGRGTRIGRSPDCDIFLDDVTVSRHHAVLLEENGEFVVEDQGSLNGTFVNHKRIDRAPLHEGDELQVGKYRLTFIA